MASSMGPATEALHAALVAATWTAPAPQVVFGAPDDYEEQQVVSVLGIDEPDEESAAIGNQRREESYVIDVRIKVHDPAASDGRAVFLLTLAHRETVRVTVAANPTLNAAVRTAEVIGGGISDGGGSARTALALRAEGGGYVCFAAARVSCKARIT